MIATPPGPPVRWHSTYQDVTNFIGYVWFQAQAEGCKCGLIASLGTRRLCDHCNVMARYRLLPADVRAAVGRRLGRPEAS